MANIPYIQQETITVHKTGKSWRIIKIFDDHTTGDIQLADSPDVFFSDDLQLLEFVLSLDMEGETSDEISNILDDCRHFETGIFVEGTYYNWATIKSILDKIKKEE